MRGKSYLSIGSVSMGIPGSIMRCEAVDMSELTRRIEEGIYNQEDLDPEIHETLNRRTESYLADNLVYPKLDRYRCF